MRISVIYAQEKMIFHLRLIVRVSVSNLWSATLDTRALWCALLV